ncbi:metallophosphoesterase [mine drainage metagenome]|uniref:Metallophosphoesterase n=1 Tax=mine drainage metagenome TaxID=410659 RepID=T1AHL9_9ZZZZ
MNDDIVGPAEVLSLTASEVDQLLDRLEKTVPTRPTLLDLSSFRADEAIVFGDTHGDWRTTERIVDRYQEPTRRRLLIGLGDYVDRTPTDCGAGSVANALYLLQWTARDPERIALIQGNHETVRTIQVRPESLSAEVRDLWGPDPLRYERLIELLGRGPLAAFHPSGPYLAHAGFPTRLDPADWKAAFDRRDERLVAQLAWSECAASRIRRGGAAPFSEAQLTAFLEIAGLSFMLRGHDPDLTGRSVFRDRCLTLHSTRVYEHYGGVIVGRLALNCRMRDSSPVSIEHLDTEGRTFGPGA